MRKIIFIAVGGSAGAILRYIAGGLFAGSYQGQVPLSTLTINLLGCFLLSFLLTEAFELLEMNTDVRLGVSTGLLGAFTTFSTFCRETVNLIYGGYILSAVLYAALSILLGFGATFLGFIAARGLAAARTRGNKLKKGADESGVR
jgi:CrcB protein